MDSGERMELVRGLCAFEGRLAGTDAERRAANWLAGRLRERGRRAEIEPIHVHPQYGLVHAIHCAIGFAGSLAAIAEPIAGFALVLFAATSMYLDVHGRLYLVRSLFFRRASQNVVSPGPNPEAPARLILCAHYDAARTGAAFEPKRARRAARLAQHVPFPIGPFRILFWSMAVLLPLLGARLAGIETTPLAVAQLPPTLVLLIGIFALVDIELSPVSPGANDNASGVAVALSLAAELDRDPPEGLDVWVLLTGGGECLQEGTRSYLRAHRRELDPERTLLLGIEAVGAGDVRFEVAAGWVVSFNLDRRMAEIATAVADADRLKAGGRLGAQPLARGIAGESLPARLRGYRALGLTCLDADGCAPGRHLPDDTPARLDPVALDRAHEFALELARALDRDARRALRARAVAR